MEKDLLDQILEKHINKEYLDASPMYRNNLRGAMKEYASRVNAIKPNDINTCKPVPNTMILAWDGRIWQSATYTGESWYDDHACKIERVTYWLPFPEPIKQ